MKIPAPLFALGSCAAGFLAAVLTLTPSPRVEQKPALSPASSPARTPAHAATAAQQAEWNALTMRAQSQTVALRDFSSEADFAELAGIRAAQDPEIFLRWLRNSPGDPPAEMLYTFFHAWAGRDARAAITAACTGSYEEFVSRDFLALFTRDPLTALDLLPLAEGLLTLRRHGPQPPPETPREVLEFLDAETVAEHLRRCPVSGAASDFARGYARFLAGKSPDSVILWAATIPEGMAPMIYHDLFGKDTALSPDTSLELMARIPADELYQFIRMNGMPESITAAAPRETLLWLNEHLGYVPRDLQSCICELWSGADRAAATEWILTECPKSQRGPLLLAVASKLNLIANPAAALQWAGDLPEDCGSSALSGVVGGILELRLPAILEFLTPNNGAFAPAQLRVLHQLTVYASLPRETCAALREWSHSQANVTGIEFEWRENQEGEECR